MTKLIFYAEVARHNEMIIPKLYYHLSKHHSEKYINTSNKIGWTAIMSVCCIRNTNLSYMLCNQLIKHGANINVKTHRNTTVVGLLFCNAKYDNKLIKLFARHGFNFNKCYRVDESIIISCAKLLNSSPNEDLDLVFDDIITTILLCDINIFKNNNRDVLFLKNVPVNYLRKYLNMIYDIRHHKQCMRKILIDIKSKAINQIYHPNNIRAQILALKNNLDNCNNDYSEIITLENLLFFEYLNINSILDLVPKIQDICQYWD
nr:ankyrin repeat domain containing protein [Mimivirus sp.]